ncbi:MAG: cation-translocating P-type ATPase [Acidobacteriaceae bacterium]
MAEALDQLRDVPHELSSTQALAHYHGNLQRGLISDEARDRLAQYGPNALRSPAKRRAILRFLRQFRNVQVYLLLAAVVVSLLVWSLEHAETLPYEALAIFAIILLNAVFGFLQEERADRALAALRSMTPAEASVIRDGQVQRIEASQLVPGDLLIVREGDRIAADARLLEVTAFHTQEAALTGESLPVLKTTAALPHDTAASDRHNMIFSGTIAISGHARALVTSTGTHTEFGKIAALLRQTEERETPLQKELDRLGKRLGVAVVVIAVVVVATLLLLHGVHDGDLILRALLFGVALAVAATPEGMAAVVTIVLALGVQRMARRGAIIRHLTAVETLGETTVIASDKTGTMTLNEMTVRLVVTASGRAMTSAAGYASGGSWTLPEGGELPAPLRDELIATLQAAALANNAALQQTDAGPKVQGDPTEAALLTAAVRAGIDLAEWNRRYLRLGEIPFSSERKRMSTLHQSIAEEDSGLFGPCPLLTKGAADLLLPRCTHEAVAGRIRTLTEVRRAEILGTHEEMAAHALRALGVAMKPMPCNTVIAEEETGEQLEQGLTFLGLVGMIDPPRPEAREAVAKASAAGVRTIMITGDHAATALAIARDLGIAAANGVITGKQLAAMDVEELASALRRVSVFARVNPEHKLRIVRALQRNGEIVAMTGDGVNDAPALKAADIGIAMGITGTDVAKEAADMVVTDDNFATIVAAIEEGRALFDNIRKFLRYLLTSNFGEILTLFLGVLLAVPLESRTGDSLILPLLAVQILWINLITDGAPALALGLDPPTPEIMRHRPIPAGQNIVNLPMIVDICLVAAVMAAGTLWVFFYGVNDGTLELRRSLAFTTLILFQLFNALNARSSVASAFRGIFRNRWLWGTIAISLALQLMILDAPVFQRAMGVTAISAAQWLRCTVVASSVLWIVEVEKVFRRFPVRQHGAIAH